MRLLSSLILILLLSACATQRRCQKKYPPQISDTIIYRDSLICIHDTVFIPQQELTFDTIGIFPETITYHHAVKKGTLTATVDIHKGKLTVECKADSIQKVLDSERKVRLKWEVKEEIKMVTEYKTHWYDIVSRFFSILVLIVLFGDLMYSYIKMKK